MPRKTIEIKRLNLRVPGLNREEAQRMGKAVAQKISESPVKGRTGRLGRLEMRLNVERGTPRDQLATLIAQSIAEKLK